MNLKRIITIMLSVIIVSTLLVFSSSSVQAAQQVGDTNGDGSIDVTDATLIQKALAEINVSKDNYNYRYADFDRNGSIDIVDVTTLQKYISDLIYTYNNCMFEINSSTATLIRYYGSAASVTIPGYVKGYKVTSISSYAFRNSTLTTITLPYQVTRLNDYAFYSCKNLTTVYTKNASLSWGNSFVNCTKFQSIKFI